LGLLILVLALAGCRAVTDRPIEAEVVKAAPLIEEPAEEAGSPSATAQSGYQEGFIEQGGPFRGDPGASVIIEEFSSYQCPFCGRYFQESYPQVVANYVETGQVLYVFRERVLGDARPAL